MTCAIEHKFRPFPGTLYLFCTACGLRSAPNIEPASKRRADPSNSSAPSKFEQLPLLPESDPDIDEAREMVDQSAFEEAVDAIINASGLDPEDAQRFRDDAIGFGRSLDLDHFARLINGAAESVT